MEREYLVVVTSFPSREAADAASAELVERRLAACVQVAGPIASTYRWQGQIEMSTEWSCTIKTRRDRYADLETALRKLHPYDTPEILAHTVVEGSPDYLRWIDASLDGE